MTLFILIMSKITAFAAPYVAKLIPWKPFLYAAAIIVFYVYVERTTTWREQAKCHAKAVQSQLDATKKDVSIIEKAAKVDQQTLDQLEAWTRGTEVENDAYRTYINSLPIADQCILTPERLRGPAKGKPDK